MWAGYCSLPLPLCPARCGAPPRAAAAPRRRPSERGAARTRTRTRGARTLCCGKGETTQAKTGGRQRAHTPRSERVLGLREVKEGGHGLLQDVVGVLGLLQDVVHNRREGEQNANACTQAASESSHEGARKSHSPTMAARTSGAARPFSNRKAGRATPMLTPPARVAIQ